MANVYSWSEMRGGGTYRLPGPEHIGWWAAVAMLLSVLLHVAVFFAVGRMHIGLKFGQAHELSTGNINLKPVEVRPMDDPQSAPPEAVVKPPVDTAALLEETELLAALPKNVDIDIKPDIQKPEYALKMSNPALEGDPAAVAMEVSSGLEVAADLPEPGRQPTHLLPAEIGQVTVDPGAVQVDDELGKFTEDLIRRGAHGKTKQGALDGVASLDDLLDLPPNILLAKKTMLPSDLLFEFNESDLRESAKVGLMKLALLMDRNPQLYCWIEGHTDLVGGDAFNLDLSLRRAEAVKAYLAKSLRMDASRISTRGFGRRMPLVTTGTPEEQSVNRRVEIRMRKTPPTTEPAEAAPQKATVIESPPPPPTPKPVLVKPKRALPVEVEQEPVAPRAAPVELAPPAAPRAAPVELAPPRATPRALPVEE